MVFDGLIGALVSMGEDSLKSKIARSSLSSWLITKGCAPTVSIGFAVAGGLSDSTSIVVAVRDFDVRLFELDAFNSTEMAFDAAEELDFGGSTTVPESMPWMPSLLSSFCRNGLPESSSILPPLDRFQAELEPTGSCLEEVISDVEDTNCDPMLTFLSAGNCTASTNSFPGRRIFTFNAGSL